jgi:ribosomal protein S18 acetylase RimI-like enzyme
MEELAILEEEKRKKKANITVRQMQIDDVAPVFHLGERLFTAKVPNLFRTWDEYEVINFFQNDSESCLVAEDGDDETDGIIGFVLGTTVTKNHSAWKYGYLVWLGVDPAFHESGVASRLFKRFSDLMLAEGARMLLVDSEADNLPALQFFRKMGFGRPQEHIFLTLNLDSLRQKRNGRHKNGNGD